MSLQERSQKLARFRLTWIFSNIKSISKISRHVYPKILEWQLDLIQTYLWWIPSFHCQITVWSLRDNAMPIKILPGFRLLFVLFCFVWFKIYLFILENEQGEGAEGEKESQRDSPLSVEPKQDSISGLWDYEIMTRSQITRVRHSTDRVTLVLLFSFPLNWLQTYTIIFLFSLLFAFQCF